MVILVSNIVYGSVACFSVENW